MAIRMIRYDALGHGLQDRSLPRLGRRHDHGPLSLPEGAEKVDDAVGRIWAPPDGPTTFQDQGFIGVLGAELGKEGATRKFLGRDPIDPVQMPERSALPILGAFPDISLEFIPGSEVELLDNPGADIDVIFPGGVGPFPTTDEARASRKDFQNAKGLFVRHASVTISKEEKCSQPRPLLVPTQRDAMQESWVVKGEDSRANPRVTHSSLWSSEKRDHPGNLRSGLTAW